MPPYLLDFVYKLIVFLNLLIIPFVSFSFYFIQNFFLNFRNQCGSVRNGTLILLYWSYEINKKNLLKIDVNKFRKCFSNKGKNLYCNKIQNFTIIPHQMFSYESVLVQLC